MHSFIERPRSLLSRIRRMIDAAIVLPRAAWLTLKAATRRGARLILDARRDHILRRARHWGTYS